MRGKNIVRDVCEKNNMQIPYNQNTQKKKNNNIIKIIMKNIISQIKYKKSL